MFANIRLVFFSFSLVFYNFFYLLFMFPLTFKQAIFLEKKMLYVNFFFRKNNKKTLLVNTSHIWENLKIVTKNT